MGKPSIIVNGRVVPLCILPKSYGGSSSYDYNITFDNGVTAVVVTGAPFNFGYPTKAPFTEENVITYASMPTTHFVNESDAIKITANNWIYSDGATFTKVTSAMWGSTNNYYNAYQVTWDNHYHTNTPVSGTMNEGNVAYLVAVGSLNDDGGIYDAGIACILHNTGRPDYSLIWYVGSFTRQGTKLPNDTVVTPTDRSDDTNSGGGGGIVTGSNPNTVVGIPSLPNVDVGATGNMLYSGTVNIVKEFRNFLWSDAFIDNIKKFYNNPSEAVLGFSVVDDDLDIAGTENIVIGNLDTGVIANRVNAWQQLDCGSVRLYEVYGAYTDYSPYVSVQLYLPKIGIVDIDTDIVMNNTLHIVYNYELCTGSGVCYLLISNTRDNTETIYKYYPCRVTATLPWSLSDRSQQVSAMINACTSTVMGAVSGGVGGAVNSAVQGVLNVTSSKQHIMSNGNLSGVSSLLGCKYPYFIIKRDLMFKPSNYNKYHGYLLYATDTIKNHKGFTVISEPRIDFECPSEVELLIKQHLSEGIIIN